MVFEHAAFTWQLCVPFVHSSSSKEKLFSNKRFYSLDFLTNTVYSTYLIPAKIIAKLVKTARTNYTAKPSISQFQC